jgi:hypothetical protein
LPLKSGSPQTGFKWATKLSKLHYLKNIFLV